MALGRKKGWIGIDLGPRTLKLAQVERTRTGMRIATSVVMPRIRPSKSEGDASAQSCDWTSQEVSAALSLKTGFTGRTAACVLPMYLTELSALTLPPGENAERRAMVAHELSPMFSGDEREREFDFWETASASTASPSDAKNVNVLSVPRKLMSRVARNLSGARLSCQVMDGLPFVLARAVKMAHAADPEAPIGAVDWGFVSTTFCVVSGGGPLFTRHLRSCGARLLVDAVSEALSFSEDEAMQVLASYGLPGPDDRIGEHREIQEVIADVTAHQMNEMAEEVNRTLSYIETQYSGILPKQLCLFGEGAAVRNVTPFLSEKTGLPVNVWRLPCSENEVLKDPKDQTTLLGTAVALSALAWE